jgi:hypothetical protein
MQYKLPPETDPLYTLAVVLTEIAYGEAIKVEKGSLQDPYIRKLEIVRDLLNERSGVFRSLGRRYRDTVATYLEYGSLAPSPERLRQPAGGNELSDKVVSKLKRSLEEVDK